MSKTKNLKLEKYDIYSKVIDTVQGISSNFDIIDTEIQKTNDNLKDIESIIGTTAGSGSVDLSLYASKEYVNTAISNIDMSTYANKEYVDSAIDSINIPENDMSAYVTSDELLLALNTKADIANTVTQEYVDSAIENIDISEVDLSSLEEKADKTYVDNAIYNAIGKVLGGEY